MKKWMYAVIILTIASITVMAEPSFDAAVQQNNSWGVIDGTNKKIIPLKYDRVGLSLENDKAVSKDAFHADVQKNKELGLIEVQSHGLRGFFNREGKPVIPVSYDRRSSWNDHTLLVRVQGKYGYYKSDGTIIASPQYDSAAVFSEGLASVGQQGRYGYIDERGTLRIPLQYGQAGSFQQGRAAVCKNGKWGVIDIQGKEYIPCVYDDMQSAYENGYIGVQKNGLWGFADSTGRIVIMPQYKKIVSSFHEGFAAVAADKGVFFINTNGNALTEPLSAIYGQFNEGLAPVRFRNGTKGYIDAEGKMVIKANYDTLGTFQNNLAEYGIKVRAIKTGGTISVSVGGNDHYGYPAWQVPLARNIGICIGGDPYYDDSEPYFGYRNGTGMSLGITTSVGKEERRGYIDTTGKIIIGAQRDIVYPMTKDGTYVRNRSLWGYVRIDGSYLIPPAYKSLERSADLGLFLAENERNVWGGLSLATGQTIIPFKYDGLQSVGAILAYKEGKKWGLLQPDGRERCRPVFDEIVGTLQGDRLLVKTGKTLAYVNGWGMVVVTLASNINKAGDFSGGYAPIQCNGKWGVIDTNGYITVSPEYEGMKVLD
ncbi:MAG: WG repeat-containing protein [Megasphaera sp.]|jgi:hypothetical protein|nr:WG repeat-containing protein [Megasphaera sp.]MCI1823971.1 WG repeat-containing protein [Megasphaera sp.]